MIKTLLSGIFLKIKKNKSIYIDNRREFIPTINIQKQWYGNDYGGFFVASDYVDVNSVVYSIGIGEDISFDTALHEEFGCDIFMYDPTPKSIQWVAAQQLSPSYHFFELGISNKTGTLDFYLPKNKNYVSGSLLIQDNVSQEDKVTVSVNTLKDAMKTNDHTFIDVLKMDIEGAEYDVIDNILGLKMPIRQILVEFHSRFYSNGINMTTDTIKKMAHHGYQLFAISDSLEEASFIKT